MQSHAKDLACCRGRPPSAACAVQTSVKAKCPPGLEMSAHILTSGYWPSYPVLDAKLPAELTQYQVRPTPMCVLFHTAVVLSSLMLRLGSASSPCVLGCFERCFMLYF